MDGASDTRPLAMRPMCVMDVDFTDSARIDRFLMQHKEVETIPDKKKKIIVHLLQKCGSFRIHLHIFSQFLTAYLWADSRRWSRPSPPGWGWAEGWRAGWCWSWRSPGTSWLRWARNCGSPASGRPGRKTGRCAAWAARTGGRGEKAAFTWVFKTFVLFLRPLTFSFGGSATHLIQMSFTERHMNNKNKCVPNIHYGETRRCSFLCLLTFLTLQCWIKRDNKFLFSLFNVIYSPKKNQFFLQMHSAFCFGRFWFIRILSFFFLFISFQNLCLCEFATSLDTWAGFWK